MAAASMRRKRPARGLARALPVALGFALAGSSIVAWASPPETSTDPASASSSSSAVEAAVWRFKDASRPIKVVVLAGSIGAWPRDPYAEQIEAMCSQVEVKNLSKVGEGALALKQRYKRDVVANRRVNLRAPGEEHWLIFQGGLNSVGTPEMTNHHIRELFVLAHNKGAHVIGLSLTPWGDDSDRRWKGVSGLRYLEYTKKVVDFVLGRLSPSEALGSYEAKRELAGQTWSANELPDIAVDLYDSSLRARDAAPRDAAALAVVLKKESWWVKRNSQLDDAARQAALLNDAAKAASVPSWYLRDDLRSFDHIHPNTEGHRLIATSICPSLPTSWGCTCPAS